MQAHVTIHGVDGADDRHFHIGPLELVQCVASVVGFNDVDLEPEASGYKITARNPGGLSFSCKGETMRDAAEKLTNMLWEQLK